MAKNKIQDLANELKKDSKDIIAFLNDKGIDAKVSRSVIDDSAAVLVRKEFGEEPVERVKKDKMTDSFNENNNEKLPPKKEMTKASMEENTVNHDEEPRKKKKIIINLNPENSGGTNRARSGGQNQNFSRSQGRSGGMRDTPHRIIKPLTAPTMPERTQPDRKPQPLKKPRPQPPVSEEAVIDNDINVNVSIPAAEQKKEEAQLPETSVLNKEAKAESRRSNDNNIKKPPVPNREGNQAARPPGPRRDERHGTGGQRRSQGELSDRQARPPRSGERPHQARSGQGADRRHQAGSGQGADRAYQARSGQGQDRTPRTDGVRRPAGTTRTGGTTRAGSPNYSSDRRPPYNNAARPGALDSRPGKIGDRPDSRFARPGNNRPGSSRTGSGRPGSRAGEGNKHLDEKRRQNAERDRRSKKEFRFVDEDALANTRQRRVGAFIRPEKQVNKEAEEQIKVINIAEILTIKELAEKMKMPAGAIVKKLFLQGKVVNVNTEISYEEAEEIAIEYEIICEKEVKVDIIEELLKEDDEKTDELVKRSPIVCVMGHVDHGKTSLLDAIRKTHVTDKESGGITQHIGAYSVEIKGQSITFLDTPGHEAFTAMRMRGANATDIAILVVAADDGVMPQTKEAISHAKAAGIEIIVAINKIDKPSANPDRVKQEMTEHELIPTDWGGQTEFVHVSAKSGAGIENLLETIILTADILELKANPRRQARGMVIEAELDKGRGPVATVLVQKGTLNVGDFISAGASHGKVRAMIDDKGRRVRAAIPSMPVEILGLSDVPSAGEIFLAHETDKVAKNYADTYHSQNKVRMLEDTKSRMSLDDLFNRIQAGNLKELNVIIKADVQGSVEAVKQSLLKLSNEEVVVKCIHGGVGAINESDVSLASTSSAIIIGFNVRPDVMAKASAEREGVDIRLYKVIYQAIEDIEAAMKGMLDPIFEEKIIGHAEIRQIFRASAIGNISGSYVLDGNFVRNCKVRISRGGEQVFEGELASLKRFKDDVKEVRAGYECGLVFEGFDQVQELDIVEAYIMVEVPR